MPDEPDTRWIPTRQCACGECRYHDPQERPWCPEIPRQEEPPEGAVWLHRSV